MGEGREGGREGGRERGREGGSEGGKEGGRVEWRKGRREEGKEGLDRPKNGWIGSKQSGYTVYQEIFAVKKISRLSVTAKISRTKFFLQRNTVTIFLIQVVRCRPQYHPRRLLQQIEKWKKPSVPHLVGNVGHTRDCSGRNWQVRLPS